MSQYYYCPDCLTKLEKKEGCGSISYFCYTCKKLVSRSKMLTKEQLDEQVDPQTQSCSDDTGWGSSDD